jgi:hypothetical protein
MSRKNRSHKTKRANYKNRGNHKSKTKSNFIWNVVFTSVLLIFGGIGYIAFSVKPSAEVDIHTFCPTDTTLTKSHTIFMVDATDKISQRYTKRLQKHIGITEREMKKYDRLTVLVLSDEEDNYVEEKFSMCSSGRGKEIDPLLGSPKIVERKWKKTFHMPLQKLLGELENLPEAKKTPLLDGISQVVSRLDFDSTVKHRKLFILSDMMHSTKEFSNYGTRTTKKLLESNFIQNFDFDFMGIDVEVELIKRTKLKKYQTRVFKNFWKSFFEEYGASSVRLY